MKRVLVVTEKIDEILADKVVALPTSLAKFEDGVLVPTPRKIRHRDIWDIAWLIEQGAKSDASMARAKINDYGIFRFEQLLDYAIDAIRGIVLSAEFKAQMKRFIRKGAYDNAFGKVGYDDYLADTVSRLLKEFKLSLAGE
jgi:hypothetical protein